MTEPQIPATDPHKIAPDTWLITNLAPAEPGTYVAVNSMVILGEQPIVIDTGAPIHRENWRKQVLSLVDPADVRWIYLSHDDGDHTGSLHDMLELCPNATLVGNFFLTERLNLERQLPIERMVWAGPGETLDIGDRKLHLVLPAIFDGPTTRGVYDEKTAVLWTVDSFAALTPGAVHEYDDIPRDLYDESFPLFNSLVSPWHQFLDPVAYGRHLDGLEGLGLLAVASAHGPVLRGDAIADAFARVRRLAGQPIVQPPGQEVLDELLASLKAA